MYCKQFQQHLVLREAQEHIVELVGRTKLDSATLQRMMQVSFPLPPSVPLPLPLPVAPSAEPDATNCELAVNAWAV